MDNFQRIRKATLDARARTGDKRIGVNVGDGIYAVILAIPPAAGRGKYVIDYQWAGRSADEAIKFLETMQ